MPKLIGEKKEMFPVSSKWHSSDQLVFLQLTIDLLTPLIIYCKLYKTHQKSFSGKFDGKKLYSRINHYV